MEHLISPIKFYAKQISSRTFVVTPLLFRLSQIYWNFHLVFISGLWCNTVQNQLCYSYIVEKLRCCLLPLPTKSVLPLFLRCNRHYKYCILLNFLWQYKLFVFKWSSVQAFSICIFLTVWIYCHIPKLLKLHWADLFPNYIQSSSRNLVLPAKKMRTMSKICMLSVEIEWKHWSIMFSF